MPSPPSSSLDAPTPVIHSVSAWLAQTTTWIYTLVRHLPPPFEARVVCDEKRNLEQFPLPDIRSLSDSRLRWLLWQTTRLPIIHEAFLKRQAQEWGARLLHSHFGVRGWQDLKAARQAGLKHVVSFYGYDVIFVPRQYPRWRDRYRRLFEEADRVLCEGPHMAASVARLGCPEEKIRIHRLGVETDAIPFRPRTWNPGEPLRVLIAASFREKKGIPYALEALARIRGRVDLQVTLIGDATREKRTQEEKRRILEAIERHELRDVVRLQGYQPHRVLLSEASDHHLFLSPSVTAEDGDVEGGAPVGLIEMAATGMPIVSTRHCDIPQVVEDGVTGLLAEERDVQGLVDHLLWLVENPDRWHEMVHRARQHVEIEFDARTQARRLADTYRELVQPER